MRDVSLNWINTWCFHSTCSFDFYRQTSIAALSGKITLIFDLSLVQILMQAPTVHHSGKQIVLHVTLRLLQCLWVTAGQQTVHTPVWRQSHFSYNVNSHAKKYQISEIKKKWTVRLYLFCICIHVIWMTVLQVWRCVICRLCDGIKLKVKVCSVTAAAPTSSFARLWPTLML